MKYLNLLLFIILFSSCCGAKQVAENTTTEQKEVVVETETAGNIEIKTVATSTINTNPTLVETTESDEAEAVKEIYTEKETPVKEVQVSNSTSIVANPDSFDHSSWNSILKKQVTKAGNVNYKSIKSNRKALTNYITSLGENMPNNNWTTEDKLAYWINAYNAMTVDLIVRNYPVESIKDIKDPWEQRLWKLENKWYNLDEIEHQILRKMNEPRIHFAIVCASFSCPKLQNEAFTASNLEAQLTSATKEFLEDKNRNEISENSVKISKIFRWFKEDFEQNGDVLDFINKYTSVNISERASKSYLDYNWDLND